MNIVRAESTCIHLWPCDKHKQPPHLVDCTGPWHVFTVVRFMPAIFAGNRACRGAGELRV